MSLQQQVMQELKTAMKAKDTVALESLRAIKSALLLAKTDKGGGGEMTESEEIALVQKLVKQRKDSAAIYTEQGRDDLAAPELAQIAVLERFLPEQLSEAEVLKEVQEAIQSLGATSMKDMGRVMGVLSGKLGGKADGKTIANLVRQELNK
ncbi:GatB/YqeY domain-containing protein [Robiginitalea aurantiaca]|uniref:GatB/YqeY domain-containing protein n=1 Tax=Robiginitalea aurantiaca TaxID=3056915 RepID=A0ABT7WI67_9FLAO|nr:GatB/YqeY domain-containing protein [Robiginitalea aurantiaca]MDM9632558.1 GatB/YqeY domain-containing protein [Robiginitalea aurantiaca]